VVGVDGSTGSEAAPAFAFDEASRRQTELCAIHVFDPSTVRFMANLPQADLRRLHLAASDTLSNLLATPCKHASVRACVGPWRLHSVLHHASCPVAVVRGQAEREDSAPRRGVRGMDRDESSGG
jgi:nucleotide-binding universal stress UspA family protein